MKAVEAYRRMRYWLIWFVILNAVTWVMLGTSFGSFIWWPIALAFFHYGRADAYVDAEDLRRGRH